MRFVYTGIDKPNHVDDSEDRYTDNKILLFNFMISAQKISSFRCNSCQLAVTIYLE